MAARFLLFAVLVVLFALSASAEQPKANKQESIPQPWQMDPDLAMRIFIRLLDKELHGPRENKPRPQHSLLAMLVNELEPVPRVEHPARIRFG